MRWQAAQGLRIARGDFQRIRLLPHRLACWLGIGVGIQWLRINRVEFGVEFELLSFGILELEWVGILDVRSEFGRHEIGRFA